MTLSTPLVRILIGLSTAAAAMLWNGQAPDGSNTLTTNAQARIGRPHSQGTGMPELVL